MSKLQFSKLKTDFVCDFRFWPFEFASNFEFRISCLILFFISYFLLLTSNTALAQTAPQFLVSWKAVNFIPSDYSEKILPSNGSRIEVGFDLIDRNKTVNLSGYEISWFVNNEVAVQRNGLKSFSFNASGNAPQTVRMVVSGYLDSELENTVTIPLANPKIIIDARQPVKYALNRTELPLKNHIFEMRPFFFNVNSLSELDLKWRLNGNLIATDPQNPEFASLELLSEGRPKQTELNLSASASNRSNILELASKTINYLVR